MSRFVKLTRHNAYDQLAVTLRRSQEAMQRAYLAAVEASDKCNALIKESSYRSMLGHNGDAFASFGLADDRRSDDIEVSERLHLEAEVEDMQADWQASVVVLFADRAMRSFERRILPSDQAGLWFGPVYNDGVRLTELLRAGGNAIRHVSEWEDNEALSFPYDIERMKSERETCRARGKWDDEDEKRFRNAVRAYENIRVFQRAFGKGIHERISEMQSWAIVSRMDGLYGTHVPDYARVEHAIVEAARNIAEAAGSEASERLTAALTANEIALTPTAPVLLDRWRQVAQ